LAAIEMRGDAMRKQYAVAALSVILIAATEYAQQPAADAPEVGGPAYFDPANWGSVHPTETDNIVYATVPHIPNPTAEASPNPGTPNGIRTPVPNTGPAGTLDMHLDVYQVLSSKPTPVVIQLHGGGWIRGDRPTSSRSFAGFFAAGMSVVTVQYRNAIDAPAPAAIQDVRCAMAWVKRNAAKYNFDPNRVIPWGGSAGGHLALMAGYAPASFNPPGCTDQPKVVAVFDMYGDANLAEALTQHGGSDSVHQWLGMDLPLPGASPAAAPKPAPAAKPAASSDADYDDTAPVQPAPDRAPRWPEPTTAVLVRARELSPMTYVSPHVPPTFIINGDSDHSVDPAQSVELEKALNAAGAPNIHYVVVGGGHGNFPPAENTKGMLLALHFLKGHGVIQ
jgi:acetyl esterase/lipase